MDLEAIWQQHKRFIVKVAAGALVFSIGLAWRSSVAGEAAALAKANRGQQSDLQNDLARLEGAEGLEKGRGEALGARLEPAVLRAVSWTPEAGYALPKGERSPELFYASAAAKAAAEVEQAAARWNAQVPRGSQGLGFAVEPPAARVAEAAAQVDVHRRLALRLLGAGVRTIARVEAMDARYAPRDGGKGFVRALPARATFQASTATLAKALAELQVEGAFLEVLGCRVSAKGKAGPAPLEVELEVQALSLVDAAPEGAAAAEPQRGGARRGPRRFGRER